MTLAEVVATLDAERVWEELVEKQSAAGALVAGGVASAVAIPFLLWMGSVSLIVWALTYLVVGLATGYLIRKWARAVTSRFGIFASTLTALYGVISFSTVCQTGVTMMSQMNETSHCLDFVGANIGLLTGVFVISWVAAYLLGFRRFTAHDLLAQTQ